MAHLSSMTQPVLIANAVADTSYAAGNGASVDLQAYNADSCLFVAVMNNTTAGGFSMTAVSGASTTTLSTLLKGGGSTTALTVSTTAAGKIVYLDVKNIPYRYANVNHVGTGAVQATILGFPYDSKKQPVPISSDLASTVAGTGYILSVNPTTT